MEGSSLWLFIFEEYYCASHYFVRFQSISESMQLNKGVGQFIMHFFSLVE